MGLLRHATVAYVFFDTHRLLDLYFDGLWLFFDPAVILFIDIRTTIMYIFDGG